MERMTRGANNIVIRHMNGEFWNGCGFSAEYADAMIFHGPRAAAAELKAIPEPAVLGVQLINDYGLETERHI